MPKDRSKKGGGPRSGPGGPRRGPTGPLRPTTPPKPPSLLRDAKQTFARRFAPHTFRLSRRFIEPRQPRVFIEREVFLDMMHLVAECTVEIGWLGLAYRQGDNFVIRGEIFVPKQRVHSSECEITEDGLAELTEELYTTRDPDKADDLLEALTFWGHSHVNMQVDPSNQDERQMKELLGGRDPSELPWYIRGIFNKRGDAKFSVFLFDEGVVFDDVPWEVIEPIDHARRSHWRDVIDQKVERQSFQVRGFQGAGGSQRTLSAPGMMRTVRPAQASTAPVAASHPITRDDDDAEEWWKQEFGTDDDDDNEKLSLEND